MFVVKTLDDLSERTFTNDLNELEAVSNMVAFLYTIISFLIIIAIVNQSLHVWWFDLVLVFAKIVKLLVILYFLLLCVSQVLVRDQLASLCFMWFNWEIDIHIRCFIYSKLFTLWCFWDNRVGPLNYVLSSRSHGVCWWSWHTGNSCVTSRSTLRTGTWSYASRLMLYLLRVSLSSMSTICWWLFNVLLAPVSRCLLHLLLLVYGSKLLLPSTLLLMLIIDEHLILCILLNE